MSTARSDHASLTTYMAECFWPGVTKQQVADAGARGWSAAASLGAAAGRVRYLGSILVPGDEIALCLFAGSSLDAVTNVNRLAEIPFERVLEIVRVEPPAAAAATSISNRKGRT